MTNKQVICPECGCVAEVRRRKNGNRLRYMVCANGHGGMSSPYSTKTYAKILEETEQDHIGELGKPAPAIEQQAEPVPEKTQIPEAENGKTVETSTDWQPAPGERPEDLEPELEKTRETEAENAKSPDDESDSNGDGSGVVLKVAGVLGGLLLMGLGYGAYRSMKGA